MPGGVAAVGCLLLPTLLMGVTLPTLARQAAGQPHPVSAIGLLYCANIAEAPGYEPSGDGQIPAPSGSGQTDWAIYFATTLSGLCALAAETIWTRLLTLLFGASVYAFSVVLAVFLTGLAAGSGLRSVLCRILSRPRMALGWCQLLEAGAIAWTAYNLAAALVFWPVNPAISANIRFSFQLDVARAFGSMLPPLFFGGQVFRWRSVPWLSGKEIRAGSQPGFTVPIRVAQSWAHSARACF